MTKKILFHSSIKGILKDLNELPGDALLVKYRELEARNSLMLVLLATGNGARQSVIEKLRVREFKRAREEKGLWSSLVYDVKTATRGPSLLGYNVDGLRTAVEKYLSIFRPDLKDDEFVFGTSKNGNYFFHLVNELLL